MDDALPVGGSSAPVPITDVQRRAAIDRIQLALANEHIEFSQLDVLFEQVYGAASQAELEAAVAGLPQSVEPPPPVNSRHFAPARSYSLIGDVKIGGWLAVGSKISVGSVLGDAIVDVSSAAIPEDGMDIELRGLIGDLKVIVPDGARVQTTAITLIGDRKEVLVAPAPNGPVIRINMFNVLGDAKVYSLSTVPEGKLRRLWAALRKSASSDQQPKLG